MQRIGDGVLLLERDDHRVMPWKNGGGTTREIFVQGANGTDFDWRLSIADVASDGPFSPFDGYARTILLLEGDGMHLRFSDASEVRITERFQPLDFDGAADTFCTLINGPVRDFNIMSARERVRHEHAIIDAFPFAVPAAATQAVHCLGGSLSATLDDGRHVAIDPGASLLQLDGARRVQRLDAPVGSRALFVRFHRRA